MEANNLIINGEKVTVTEENIRDYFDVKKGEINLCDGCYFILKGYCKNMLPCRLDKNTYYSLKPKKENKIKFKI